METAIHNKDKQETIKEPVKKPEPALKPDEKKVEFNELGHPYVMVKHGRKQKRVHPDLVDVKKKERDSKLVRGKFKFYEQPGGILNMSFALPFLGERPKQYALKDGEIMEIPKALAEHLQNKGKYPVHSHMLDENGKPTQRVGQWVDRFDFFEIGSIVEKLPTKRIITVENI